MVNCGHIYGLVCPRANVVRYVGKTVNPSSRLWGHIRKPTSKKARQWFDALLQSGAIPRVITLEVASIDTLDAREQAWIAYYRKKVGEMLLNQMHNRPKPSRPMSDTQRALSRNLAALRGKSPVAEIAAQVAVTPDTLYKIERGDRWVSDKVLDRLAAFYSVHPSDLINPDIVV